MPLHYDKITVLFGFHQRLPASYTPTVEELEQEDADLFDGYDAHLEEQLPAHDIEVSRTTKSRVLLLALTSNGATRRVKTTNACKYYAHAWNVVKSLPFD